MTTQELIEKINKIAIETPFPNSKIVDHLEVIKLIEQLDEPKKVVVPQFVADWIEEVKPAYTLFAAMEYGNLKIDKWLDNNSNQETFALAWIFGYEVEKEKRYRVKMKNLKALFCYLARSKHDDYWSLTCSKMDGFYTTHTHKELEEAGFGWVFDCEGVEVEEVEE